VELGRFDLDGGGDIISQRRMYRYDARGSGNAFHHDLPRLVLLLVMLLAAVAGGVYNYYTGQPHKIVRRSVRRTLEKPFRASLEGATSLKTVALAFYRSRQSYTPEHGITVSYGDGGENEPPFDALTALRALEYARNVTEHDREDMYGHGTRHFDGLLELPGENASVVHSFEYWIDMRTYRAVRLIITEERRNVAVDDEGNSVSKETYLNIWYYE